MTRNASMKGIGLWFLLTYTEFLELLPIDWRQPTLTESEFSTYQ